MGLSNWFKRNFGKSSPSRETVPFLGVESGRVVHIPASELRPGAIQVQVQGSNELVWALPEQLHQGDIKHPPFNEETIGAGQSVTTITITPTADDIAEDPETVILDLLDDPAYTIT